MNSIFKTAKKKAKNQTHQKTGDMVRGLKSQARKAKAKFNKAEPTKEDPEIIGALERLKATKNEIHDLSIVIRNLYDSRIIVTTHQIELSHALRNVRDEEKDGFSQYCVAMGSGLSKLESMHNEYCEIMKESVLLVLKKFHDQDIQKSLLVKDRYKDAKNNYDIAMKKLATANNSGKTQKIKQAETKRDDTYITLQTLREEFKEKISYLETKKNTELLAQIQDHWNNYIKFVNAQSNVINNNIMPKINTKSYFPTTFTSTKENRTSVTDSDNINNNLNDNNNNNKTNNDNNDNNIFDINDIYEGFEHNNGDYNSQQSKINQYSEFKSQPNEYNHDQQYSNINSNDNNYNQYFNDINSNNNNEMIQSNESQSQSQQQHNDGTKIVSLVQLYKFSNSVV